MRSWLVLIALTSTVYARERGEYRMIYDRTVVDGVEFPPGTELRTYAGTDHLWNAKLGADAAPCGVSMPRGTYVSFRRYDDESRYVMVLMAGKNDRVEGIRLEPDTPYGLSCEPTIGVDTSKRPNRLRFATIAEPYRWGHLEIPAGSEVHWYRPSKGGVSQVYYSAGHAAGVVTATPHTTIYFYPDGGISYVTWPMVSAGFEEHVPPGIVTIHGVTCQRYRIWLYPSGRVAQCALWAEARPYGGFSFQENVELYESGAVKSGCLARDTEVDGRPLHKETCIQLSPTGKLLGIWGNGAEDGPSRWNLKRCITPTALDIL